MPAKSVVDKYEQILRQDPTSTVFVELAKALIEKGDHDQAIDVCRNGLLHHKGSVVGRVLWGKALIQQGRSAEAMAQFDEAIALDRENPHAYNLIGELLLHKGLYRSALPLLKKAAVLQPNDGRVKRWLEQTERALEGGPTPIFEDSVPETSEASGANGSDEPTQIFRGFIPVPDEMAAPPVLAPVASSTSQGVLSPEDPSNLAALSSGASGEAPGLEALPTTRGAAASGLLGDLPSAEGNPPEEPTQNGIASDDRTEQTETSLNAQVVAQVLSAQVLPKEDATQQSPPPLAATRSGEHRALLEDIPDLKESFVSKPLPRVRFTAQATEAIAKEYERELREKLAEEEEVAKQSFLARNGAKLAVAAVLLVAVAVGLIGYFAFRARHQGLDFNGALAAAKMQIAEDTQASYKAALGALKVALEMDDSSTEAWALQALVQTMLYAEHGGAADSKAAATGALEHGRVKEEYPDLALVLSYHLASPSDRDPLRKQILAGRQDALVEELAGQLLMAQKNPSAAVKRFQQAAAIDPRSGKALVALGNMRALIALGDYARESGDLSAALAFYTEDRLLKAAAKNPKRVLGLAEVRLSLGKDEAESLKEVEALDGNGDVLAPDLLARKELVHGRLLTATGNPQAAIDRLNKGLQAFKPRAFDFQLALGYALMRAGTLKPAEAAFQTALNLRNGDEAKVAMGRLLLAADRFEELLRKFPAEESRKLALLRGTAYAELKDWKRARAELAKTQVQGKFPLETAIGLALADAAEGQSEQAQSLLEKMLGTTQRAKVDVRIALGNVYWARNLLDKAREQYELASADSDEWEADCALGRVWLVQGDTERAIQVLERSVSRNDAHDDSNHALIQALFQQGKNAEALARAEAWLAAEEVDSPRALADAAIAQYLSGQTKEADATAAKAEKGLAKDSEFLRWRARIQYARGDGRGAFSSLERAQKSAPKEGETACEQALAHYRHGNSDAAQKALVTAQNAFPKPPCAAWVGAFLKPDRGNVKMLNDTVPLAKTPWDKGWLKTALSRTALAAGDAARARAEATAAVTAAPYSGFAHLALGMAALREKDDKVAKEAVIRAITLEPAMGAARLLLADLLVKAGEGELPRAIEQYEAYLKVGGVSADEARVKKNLPALKKKLAAR